MSDFETVLELLRERMDHHQNICAAMYELAADETKTDEQRADAEQEGRRHAILLSEDVIVARRIRKLMENGG